MQTSRRWIVAFAILAALTNRPVFADEPQPADYLPLREGTKWHFDAKVNSLSVPMIIRVAKFQSSESRQAARLETVVNGSVAASEYLGVSEEGIFRLKMNNIDINPPLQILRFPIKKGDAWTSTATVGGETLKADSVVDLQKVSVPAGSFEAALVTTTVSTPQGRMTNRQWFAPGIGLVKQEVNLSGAKILAELRSSEPGN
jgi:hypothetical protein